MNTNSKNIQVCIVEAKGLRNADSGVLNDVSDPYCTVWTVSKKTSRKTRVVNNNLNPVWRETFVMPLKYTTGTVCFEIRDSDTVSKADLLGISVVSLAHLRLEKNVPRELWLDVIWKKQKKGKLHVELTALDFDNLIESTDEDLLEVDLEQKLPKTRSLKSILDKVIGPKEDALLDELFGFVTVGEVYSTLQTGDILLHSGNGNFSSAIMLATGSMFSHVSMVLCNPSEKLRKAYDVPDDCKGNVFVVEAAKKLIHRKVPHGGVQLVEIGNFLDICKRNEGETDFWALRRIKLPQQPLNTQGLEDLLLSVLDRPYEKKRFEMIKSIFKSNSAKDASSYFCSEFIADVFIALGLLPHSIITNNCSPKDFSSTMTFLQTSLLQGATFASEIRIKANP